MADTQRPEGHGMAQMGIAWPGIIFIVCECGFETGQHDSATANALMAAHWVTMASEATA